ncbi:hypothetical protein VNO77_23670 [Canavalia gladiata]|uniref:MAGE domain-containing protein n=1 Tax=Canavalia gladiata TaxID=3824 RepID=A0AAN9L4U2_CANGL
MSNSERTGSKLTEPIESARKNGHWFFHYKRNVEIMFGFSHFLSAFHFFYYALSQFRTKLAMCHILLKNACRMASGAEDFSQFGISKEEKDKLVGEVIRYMLFKTHQNSGCPIKREELTQLVTKNYHQRNLPTFVINEAKNKLLTIFGYEMRELQRSLPSSKTQGRLSQQSVAESKSYILISHLPPDAYEKYVVDVNTAHLSGFTFVVIGIVYLAGGKIPEENLWSQMRRMGLGENEVSHPVLGNVKQALELLVQQRYLRKDKANGPEGNIVYYELAERALDGPISDKVKEYISQWVLPKLVAVSVLIGLYLSDQREKDALEYMAGLKKNLFPTELLHLSLFHFKEKLHIRSLSYYNLGRKVDRWVWCSRSEDQSRVVLLNNVWFNLVPLVAMGIIVLGRGFEGMEDLVWDDSDSPMVLC